MATKLFSEINADALEASCSVIDGVQDGAVLLGENFQILHANTNFFRFVGERKKVVSKVMETGKTIFDLFSLNPERDFELAMKCIHAKKTIYNTDVAIQNVKGEELIINQTFIPVLSNRGECVAMIGKFRDVTDDFNLQKGYRELLAKEKERANELEKVVAERTEQLQKALDEVVALSRIDPLTGLLNRRAFQEHFQNSIVAIKRYERCGAILMCDLDKFKDLNDTFGHQAGDIILVETAKALKNVLRGDDIVCRYGGEEFLIFLTETKHDSIMETAERCRQAVEAIPVTELVEGKKDQQTVSMGVSIIPDHGYDMEKLIKIADDSLYVSKENGRNCVTVAKV